MTVVQVGDDDTRSLMGAGVNESFLVFRRKNTGKWTNATGCQKAVYVDPGHGPGAAHAPRVVDRIMTPREAAWCSLQAAWDVKESEGADEERWLVYKPLASGVHHERRIYVGNTSTLRRNKHVKHSLFNFDSSKKAWEELIQRTKYAFACHGCVYDRVGLAYRYGRQGMWYVKESCNKNPTYHANFESNGTLNVLNFLAAPQSSGQKRRHP